MAIKLQTTLCAYLKSPAFEPNSEGMYVLPPATKDELGGIKVGDRLSVTEDGLLSVNTSTEVKYDDYNLITSDAVEKRLSLLPTPDEQTITTKNNQYTIKEDYLNNKYIRKRLSIFQDTNPTSDKHRSYVYVDENGEDKKISLANLRDNALRTVSNIPSNAQSGDYFFLEIKE